MRAIRFVATAAVALILTACASTGAATGGTASASTSAPSPVAGSIDAATAPFVGSVKSKKFYPTACQTVTLIKSADQVGFASIKDAEKAGYAKDLLSTDCRY